MLDPISKINIHFIGKIDEWKLLPKKLQTELLHESYVTGTPSFVPGICMQLICFLVILVSSELFKTNLVQMSFFGGILVFILGGHLIIQSLLKKAPRPRLFVAQILLAWLDCLAWIGIIRIIASIRFNPYGYSVAMVGLVSMGTLSILTFRRDFVRYLLIIPLLISGSAIALFCYPNTINILSAVALLSSLVFFRLLAKAVTFDSWTIAIKTLLLKNDLKKREKLETEKKKMFEKVVQSAKLASIGELAAGVGHEINNPLTIIQGRLEILKKKLTHKIEDSDFVEQEFDSLFRGIARIDHIVRGLKSYARDLSLHENEIVSLADVISDYASFISPLYEKNNINVKVVTCLEDLFVKGGGDIFFQILSNLVSNSKHAIEDLEKKRKGEITIKLDRIEEYACISISDNGKGIAPENVKQIFESFYTTKPAGRGTGIGLSIVQNYVEMLSGTVRLQKSSSDGTTFLLTFPLVEADLGAQIKNLHSIERSDPELNGKILIVEDEKEIQDILKEILEEFSFDISIFASVEDVLRSKEPFRYDYVITDLSLKGIGGDELIKIFRKSPEFQGRIIAISGYFGDLVENIQADAFIKKPFSRKVLIRHLREMRN